MTIAEQENPMDRDEQEAKSKAYSSECFLVLKLTSGKYAIFDRRFRFFCACDAEDVLEQGDIAQFTCMDSEED